MVRIFFYNTVFNLEQVNRNFITDFLELLIKLKLYYYEKIQKVIIFNYIFDKLAQLRRYLFNHRSFIINYSQFNNLTLIPSNNSYFHLITKFTLALYSQTPYQN